MDIENNKMLRLKEVMSATGLSRSSIYSYIGHGSFPPPLKIGQRSVAWKALDIQSWINSRSYSNRVVTNG